MDKLLDRHAVVLYAIAMNVKQLDRLTPCVWFDLGTPEWQRGHGRKVGLDLERIRKHNRITFSYVRKSDGKKSFPDEYYFDGDNLRGGLDYEIQERGTKKLVIVPFDHLEILERV